MPKDLTLGGWTAPENPEPQLKPILALWAGMKANDVAAISAVLSDQSYEYIVLPRSLERPTLNKQELLKMAETRLFANIKGMKV